MTTQLILVVDDEAGIRRSMRMILEYSGYTVTEAEDGPTALALARKHRPDLVLLDVKMPGMDGLEVLEKLMEDYPGLPVIILSGHGSVDSAVRATRLGAYDFLEKPPKKDRILLTIRNALKTRTLETRIQEFSTDAEWEMVGHSEAMTSVRNLITRVAPAPLPVLIRGESGTGKELVARAIHRLSTRSDGAFIQVNCAAIPEDLIENELFGHEKGAYSGAGERRQGKFEMAHRGTLFLDEIGDMSLKTQAKVLRALQEGEFQRVGGNVTLHADVRVVAATNQDLESMIDEGRFREDLFHRINGVPISIPALRDRREDIPVLVHYFRKQFASANGLKVPDFSDDSLRWMENRPWTGNIRELKNFVERHLILCTDQEITESYLAGQMNRGKMPTAPGTGPLMTAHDSLQDFKEAAEKAFLEKKLNENNWNIKATAEAIGTPRSNLYKRMQHFGIQRDDGIP
ncbi:MAG TPA: sigma-54 dependent transcriptional regulator [bacterium]|nr:sigma-54 dependent transcriptional regulator [bacterium]